MSGRRTWSLVAFVVGLGVAIIAYVRTRPVVSDSELREALAEVERVRISLDDIECERAALLGTPSQDALRLEDLLFLDGAFAECWDAVAGEEVREHLEGVAPDDGFRFEDHTSYLAPPLDRQVDPEIIRNVLSSCALLPAEVGRQSRTPNRCTPNPPSSEGWRRQNVDDESERPKLLVGQAIAISARHSSINHDDRLRLLVQGMAMARDLGQGPSGFLTAMLGVATEHRMAAHFVALLDEASPSEEARAELIDALGVLAEIPVDTHALLAAEGIALVDVMLAEGRGREEEALYGVYAAATLLPRVMESCPIGTTVEGCLSHFPYPTTQAPKVLEWLLGDRYHLEDSLQISHAMSSEFYERYVRRMEGLRANAEALQQLLRWDAKRAEGLCPDLSPWEPTANTERFFVDRNDEDLYQLVTPGAERHAFYFRCPITDEDAGSNDAASEGL